MDKTQSTVHMTRKRHMNLSAIILPSFIKKNIFTRDEKSQVFDMTFRNFVRGNPDLSLWIVVHENSTIRATYQWMWIDVYAQNLQDLVIWAQRNKLVLFLRCEHNIVKLPRRDAKHQPSLHRKQQVSVQPRSRQPNDKVLSGQGYRKSC